MKDLTTYMTSPTDRASSSISYSILHFRGIFQRNKKLIITLLIIIEMLSVSYALFAYQPEYSSNAQVLIKDSAITGKYITSDVISTTSSSAANPVLNSMELLKSEDIPKAIWKALLLNSPKDRERLNLKNEEDWIYLFGNGKQFITYKSIPGTDVIQLKFNWLDPAQAQYGMKTVLTTFQNISRKINKSEYLERYIYLTKQVADVRQELFEIRRKISQYKVKNTTSDISKELESYAENRVLFEMEMAKASAEASSYQNQLNAYQTSLKMTPGHAVNAVAIGGNETLSKLRENYYQKLQEYKTLRTHYTEQHQKVRDVKAGLDQLQQNMTQEMRRMGLKDSIIGQPAITDETRSNAVRDMLGVSSQASGAKRKAEVLHHYLHRLDRKIQKLPRAEEMMANLKERESALSNSLSMLEQKALESKMHEAQTLSNVFVIQEPTIPYKPNFPGRSAIVLIGILAGLAVGISCALFKEKIGKPASQVNAFDVNLSRELESSKSNILN